ncbi:MAG: hypothetical protein ACI4JZ_02955 [Oscillospiraceae bacterium]
MPTIWAAGVAEIALESGLTGAENTVGGEYSRECCRKNVRQSTVADKGGLR